MIPIHLSKHVYLCSILYSNPNPDPNYDTTNGYFPIRIHIKKWLYTNNEVFQIYNASNYTKI